MSPGDHSMTSRKDMENLAELHYAELAELINRFGVHEFIQMW